MSTNVMQQAQDCGLDLACRAATSAFERIISDVARGAAELVVSSAAWWTATDSIDPNDPAVAAAQGATRDLILLILVGSVLVQSIRLVLSRKSEPLIMVATGLIRYAAVSALGLVVLQGALRAGDAISEQLLGRAANDFALLMRDILTDADATFPVLLMSLVAAVLSLVQWLLMAMRQAGLLVLAAMLPLAASGSINRSTRGWLDKLLAWLIAMVAYKPSAAFIYYIGFSYLSSPSAANAGDLATMITGLMVLLLAVIAMPVLLKFFAWSGSQVGGGGSGSGFLGAAGAIGMYQGGGRGAVDRAAAMDAGGPGSQATSGGYTPPTGAAPSATAGGASAGAAAGGAAAGSAAAATGGVAAGVMALGSAASSAGRAAADGMTGGDNAEDRG